MKHKLTAQERIEKFSVKGLDAGLRDLMDQSSILSEAAHIVPFSLLAPARLKGIIRALLSLGNLAGDTAEIGCNVGGTSRLIGLLNGRRRHWAVDTFEGLVDVGQEDTTEKIVNGAFTNRLANLKDVAQRLSDLDHVRVVQGYFPACASDEMKSSRFALVHIDVDTYRSIHACFAFFLPRMVKGGIVIMDDVIGRGTAGGKQAWAEITAQTFGDFEIVEKNDPQVIIRIK